MVKKKKRVRPRYVYVPLLLTEKEFAAVVGLQREGRHWRADDPIHGHRAERAVLKLHNFCAAKAWHEGT